MKMMNKQLIRLVSIATLLMLVIAACSGPEPSSERMSTPDDPAGDVTSTPAEDVAGSEESNPAVSAEPTETADAPEAPTEPGVDPDPVATQGDDADETPSPDATPRPGATATPEPAPVIVPEHPDDLPEGVLPNNRIVAYYGHPSTGVMGILGEYSKEDLLVELREQVAEYEAADPDTPVIPAFELIATVAQAEPGSDGTYLLYTGDEWIQEYVDFTAENGMLLFLDLQIGHSTIRDQIELIWPWLQYPHVHVALDPEYSTWPDHAPGTIIGGVDGNHVNIAIEMLSELALQNNLPPKILVVHQFDPVMIFNKNAIQPLPGVDFVLHMDGWGGIEAKVGNYHHFVQGELIQYGGFKLFYRQDIPVMSAAEVLAMQPPPLFISYQ